MTQRPISWTDHWLDDLAIVPPEASWFLARVYDARAFITTARQCGVAASYPIIRWRHKSARDTFQSVIPGWSLVSFDPTRFIKLPSGEAPWQSILTMPGISGIYHDGVAPVPLRRLAPILTYPATIPCRDWKRWLQDADYEPAWPDAPGGYAAAPLRVWEPGQLVTISTSAITSIATIIDRLSTGDYKAQIELFGRPVILLVSADQVAAA